MPDVAMFYIKVRAVLVLIFSKLILYFELTFMPNIHAKQYSCVN